ncbi:hypothetical protein A33Y_015 [Candidatus Carsonella ruddii CS isolate Thao2000]|uniref:Uncharacterized protein n=1 Tax=Candidatus Carsonella ruddii CS isolate Thao2000 TaxID=1202537 RepID=J7H066_CARRU|nr:hypothetical protein [Candidatus Carsonella ruddii]AFP83680.1 hypothetical protein A33Y_015 [Candidatus Carsonella ruddii CS isolate Thao2000]
MIKYNFLIILKKNCYYFLNKKFIIKKYLSNYFSYIINKNFFLYYKNKIYLK